MATGESPRENWVETVFKHKENLLRGAYKKCQNTELLEETFQEVITRYLEEFQERVFDPNNILRLIKQRLHGALIDQKRKQSSRSRRHHEAFKKMTHQMSATGKSRAEILREAGITLADFEAKTSIDRATEVTVDFQNGERHDGETFSDRMAVKTIINNPMQFLDPIHEREEALERTEPLNLLFEDLKDFFTKAIATKNLWGNNP